MHFGSDNTSGVSPEILDALARANIGFAPSYGADDLTVRVERRLAEIFEHDVAVFLVGTGTAANSLGLAAIAKAHEAIFCRRVQPHLLGRMRRAGILHRRGQADASAGRSGQAKPGVRT